MWLIRFNFILLTRCIINFQFDNEKAICVMTTVCLIGLANEGTYINIFSNFIKIRTLIITFFIFLNICYLF